MSGNVSAIAVCKITGKACERSTKLVKHWLTMDHAWSVHEFEDFSRSEHIHYLYRRKTTPWQKTQQEEVHFSNASADRKARKKR